MFNVTYFLMHVTAQRLHATMKAHHVTVARKCKQSCQLKDICCFLLKFTLIQA